MNISSKNVYLIIDLEATCWENHLNKENMETIEIGAVLVNNDYKIIEKYQTFIKPIKNPILSKFCKDLTSIKQEDIDNAKIFPISFKNFIQWVETKSKCDMANIVFCSWGYYDKKQLIKDCELHNIKYPFQNHYSLKHIFAETKKLKKPVGMKKALQICKIPLKGEHHRGIDDARNIAKIFIQEKII
jgi:3'-5' exoribonuclease 1